MTYQQANDKLKELLTPEFMEKLIEVARLSGWQYAADFTEVQGWIDTLYSLTTGEELPIGSLDPYDKEEI
jgi:hypothetical protein